MNKIAPLFVLVAILFVLMLPRQAALASKAHMLPQQPDAPVAVTSTPTAMPTAVPTGTAPPTIPTPVPDANQACLRINFEVSGDVALAGMYEVVEVSGRSLVSWTAQAGWQDSGWLRNISISFEAVHVQVLYHPPGGGDPVNMVIVNPAPDLPYGWVANGICHALEVGWP
ncbi:hypothetical protein [Candidatus Leptofilum sp.]|uniref:hypothetical protein n=1 Tax=Candidatus Leptofilum sp. TaxID=3241576 RepID=UPI003B58ECBF